MSARVLVLNRNWTPINVIGTLEAAKKVFKGRALFLDVETCVTYDFESWVENWQDAIRTAKVAADKVVASAGISFLMPEVIVCSEYRGFGFKLDERLRPKFSRRNLYLRDRNTCQFCGKRFPTDELTMDHVIPKSKGGLVTWKNIVLACVPCNHKKGNQSLADCGMQLTRKPFEPTVDDLRLNPVDRVKFKLGRRIPKTWGQFLGKMYWEIKLDEV